MNHDAESSAESLAKATSTGQEPARKFVRLGEVSLAATPDREANDPIYPEAYYEYLEQAFGPEKAAWARLPRAQRREELKKIHEQYNTPDDLDPIPPELGGGVWNP
jgi:hypothetical protein